MRGPEGFASRTAAYRNNNCVGVDVAVATEFPKPSRAGRMKEGMMMPKISVKSALAAALVSTCEP